jgi:serine/threonine protein kinase
MIAIEPGVVLSDRYELEMQLGAGGMGVVWSARDLTTGQFVALKVLRPDEDDTQSSRRRFMREARAAAAVRHPNVVMVHDVLLLEDGTPVIVMELLEGEPLSARLRREKTLSVEELARVLLPVVSAVGSAHALGIVHRDLKPDNIFLAREGDREVVKVVDFGIAKITLAGDGEKTGGLTTTGTVLGTPFYMSPEQAFGEKDIDYRSDIWSLGILVHKCLTGVVPTKADNAGQTLKIILSDKIPPLSAIAPETPADIVELVRKMLRVDRDARPGDLREVKDVLQEHAPDVKVPEFAGAVVPPPHSSAKSLASLTEHQSESRIATITKRDTLRASFEATKKMGAQSSEPSVGGQARSISVPPPSPWRARLVILGAGAALTIAGSLAAVRLAGPVAAKTVPTAEPPPPVVAAAPPPTATEAPPAPPLVDAGAPAPVVAAATAKPVAKVTARPATAPPTTAAAPVPSPAPSPNNGKFVEKPPF